MMSLVLWFWQIISQCIAIFEIIYNLSGWIYCDKQLWYWRWSVDIYIYIYIYISNYLNSYLAESPSLRFPVLPHFLLFISQPSGWTRSQCHFDIPLLTTIPPPCENTHTHMHARSRLYAYHDDHPANQRLENRYWYIYIYIYIYIYFSSS